MEKENINRDNLSAALTADILERNGFDIDDDEYHVWTETDGAYTVAAIRMYEEDEGVWEADMCGPNVTLVEGLRVSSVGELQRAMDVCGIAKEITL